MTTLILTAAALWLVVIPAAIALLLRHDRSQDEAWEAERPAWADEPTPIYEALCFEFLGAGGVVMSADLLREAAAKMRERAEAATPGPWSNRRGPGEHVMSNNGGTFLADTYNREDRRHIASWHPAVALAVAKAMDDVAHAWEIADDSDDGYVYDADNNHYRFDETVDAGWVAVARAYLRREDA